jgi:hypothetical protein
LSRTGSFPEAVDYLRPLVWVKTEPEISGF